MGLSNFIQLGFAGGYEWIIIILAIVLLGGRKIPELMKGLGQGMSEFKKARKDVEDIKDSETKDSIKE